MSRKSRIRLWLELLDDLEGRRALEKKKAGGVLGPEAKQKTGDEYTQKRHKKMCGL